MGEANGNGKNNGNNKSNNEKNTGSRPNSSQKKKKRSAAALARRAAKWSTLKAEKKAEGVAASAAKQEAKRLNEERKQQAVISMFPDIMGIVGAQGFMPNIRKVSMVSKSLAANLKTVPLFQNADRATIYPNGMTLLNKYLEDRNWAKAMEVLTLGVPKRVLDHPTSTGDSPLFFTMKAHQFDLFKKLLDKGADPNQERITSSYPYGPKNTTKNTILIYLMQEYMYLQEKKKYANELLAHGADINKRDSFGYTALERVLYSPDEVLFLIEKGAALEEPNASGFTPVLTAISKGKTNILNEFMKKGIDLDKKTANGNLFPLKVATLSAKNDIFTMVLNGVKEIDAKDEAGNTALHYAVLTKNFQKIALLKQKGANPKISNKKGSTAMQLAMALDQAGDKRAYNILKE